MTRLRVHNLTMSVDGYVAGPHQSLDDPLGVGGIHVHDWIFEGDARTTVDDDYIARGTGGIGATIMGRNMFGPIRGPWSDERWTGWWGDDPPFHHPVFVLTHHPHEPIPMDGGTTFFFVASLDEAMARAADAAGDQDVRIGGGASTVQQFLRRGLIDDLHLAVVPIFLGGGERLFDDLEGGPTGYECVELVASPTVVHLRFTRTPVSDHR